METTKVSFNIPTDKLCELDSFCTYKLDRTSLINEAIELFLKSKKNKEAA